MKYISIESVKYIDSYRLFIKFDDGKEQIVDFSDFILNSHHPDIQKYKNTDLFKKFVLEYGDLQWNDYDLSFPIYDLYENNLEQNKD